MTKLQRKSPFASTSSFAMAVPSTAARLFQSGRDGYWTGWMLPSTVEWCETNYEVCSYVAEFCNTFSSLAIIGTRAR